MATSDLDEIQMSVLVPGWYKHKTGIWWREKKNIQIFNGSQLFVSYTAQSLKEPFRFTEQDNFAWPGFREFNVVCFKTSTMAV